MADASPAFVNKAVCSGADRSCNGIVASPRGARHDEPALPMRQPLSRPHGHTDPWTHGRMAEECRRTQPPMQSAGEAKSPTRNHPCRAWHLVGAIGFELIRRGVWGDLHLNKSNDLAQARPLQSPILSLEAGRRYCIDTVTAWRPPPSRLCAYKRLSAHGRRQVAENFSTRGIAWVFSKRYDGNDFR